MGSRRRKKRIKVGEPQVGGQINGNGVETRIRSGKKTAVEDGKVAEKVEFKGRRPRRKSSGRYRTGRKRREKRGRKRVSAKERLNSETVRKSPVGQQQQEEAAPPKKPTDRPKRASAPP